MKLLLLLIVLTIAGRSSSSGQVEAAQNPLPETPRRYNVDAISFASAASAQGRLDVFVQVPYDLLGFLKADQTYRASYEITIGLYDSSGKLYTERVWTEEVSTPTFEESASPNAYSLTQKLFDVPPGSYTVTTVVRDLEIRAPIRQNMPVVVPDFYSQSFSLSGIMLISRMTLTGERRVIVPHVSPNVGVLLEGFYAFIEVYDRRNVQNAVLVTEVLDEKGASVLREETSQPLTGARTQVFVRVSNKKLTMGDYVLRLQAFSADSTRELLATTERPFIVRWRGIPLAVKDLDRAIDQLQYIANAGEIERMKEESSEEEKRRLFMEFWKKRDPNPNTPRNEKMEEHYSRVEYANKHFGHYFEGWRTDMGMVFIIFGAPNNVDRHPFDIDAKPYEVWSYYDLNHQFVFVDETGFGDYRLVTPIWEVWQRPE
jgi:GWxTD domain-containing protein